MADLHTPSQERGDTTGANPGSQRQSVGEGIDAVTAPRHLTAYRQALHGTMAGSFERLAQICCEYSSGDLSTSTQTANILDGIRAADHAQNRESKDMQPRTSPEGGLHEPESDEPAVADRERASDGLFEDDFGMPESSFEASGSACAGQFTAEQEGLLLDTDVGWAWGDSGMAWSQPAHLPMTINESCSQRSDGYFAAGEFCKSATSSSIRTCGIWNDVSVTQENWAQIACLSFPKVPFATTERN